MSKRVPDEELLRRVQHKDERALTEMFDRYGGLVLAVALRVLGDRELAEEVMQDTFLRCWNAADTYERSRGNVAAWLIGIARNRAIDVLRSRQHKSRLREHASSSRWSSDEPSMPDEAETIATRQAVIAALNALPRTHREVIELAYYGGLSQSEIAQRLGNPLGTVKSRNRAAMDQLRTLLRPQFHTDLDKGDDE